MRFLIFVLTLVSSAPVFAAQAVAGTVYLESGTMYLRTDDPCRSYMVASSNQAALSALVKLAAGDVVTATGVKDPGQCTVSIESVDYVGLRRMLGSWYSREAIISVENFNSMKFYPTTGDVNPGSGNYAQVTTTPIEYNYSIVPSAGKEWVLFLSDSRSTTFSTIEFNKANAVLKIYNSATGALNKTLILYRTTSGIN